MRSQLRLLLRYLRCLAQVVEWFCGGLDYEYTPAIHGSQPEWLADLISTSFDKPLKTFKRSMQTRKVLAPPSSCCRFCAEHLSL